MDIYATFNKIDRIKSIRAMRLALEGLPETEREEVILEGLRSSQFQHTWSYFAEQFNVPTSKWPRAPSCSRFPRAGSL